MVRDIIADVVDMEAYAIAKACKQAEVNFKCFSLQKNISTMIKDFRLNMLDDQMASEKLSEGITGFSKAIEELEQLLLKRFSDIKNQKLISAN